MALYSTRERIQQPTPLSQDTIHALWVQRMLHSLHPVLRRTTLEDRARFSLVPLSCVTLVVEEGLLRDSQMREILS